MTIAAPATCHNAVDVSGVTALSLHRRAQVCIVRAAGTFAYSGIGMLSLLSIGPITLNAIHRGAVDPVLMMIRRFAKSEDGAAMVEMAIV